LRKLRHKIVAHQINGGQIAKARLRIERHFKMSDLAAGRADATMHHIGELPQHLIAIEG
jgi:hypothetical protein